MRFEVSGFDILSSLCFTSSRVATEAAATDGILAVAAAFSVGGTCLLAFVGVVLLSVLASLPSADDVIVAVLASNINTDATARTKPNMSVVDNRIFPPDR